MRKEIQKQAQQFKERYADDPSGFERMVVRHVASHPWEPFEQTAAYYGLPGAAAVERLPRARWIVFGRMRCEASLV